MSKHAAANPQPSARRRLRRLAGLVNHLLRPAARLSEARDRTRELGAGCGAGTGRVPDPVDTPGTSGRRTGTPDPKTGTGGLKVRGGSANTTSVDSRSDL